jgi:hypothetical protein
MFTLSVALRTTNPGLINIWKTGISDHAAGNSFRGSPVPRQPCPATRAATPALVRVIIFRVVAALAGLFFVVAVVLIASRPVRSRPARVGRGYGEPLFARPLVIIGPNYPLGPLASCVARFPEPGFVDQLGAHCADTGEEPVALHE